MTDEPHYFRPAPDATDDGEAICGACGHRSSAHTQVAGEPGDCLHRTEGRFDCDCESFTDTEED